MINNFPNINMQLINLVLKRERIRIIVWIIALVSTSISVAFTFTEIYTSNEEMQMMVETLKNPAMIAMIGPVYGADSFSKGALFSSEMLLFTILAVAVMNIIFVVRHTRKDEDYGRIEMIRSLPTGRLSTLSSTMIVAFIMNFLLAIFTGIGIAILNIDSMDFHGSMLYGVALGVSGLLFAAFTALFSQLAGNSKGATGYAFLFLGFSYLLRAAGDINNEVLSRISPLGLVLRCEVYSGNLWWPIIILLLEVIVVTAIAFYLNSLRDMGQGFIAVRPGRKHASPLLLSPMGLGMKLLSTTLIYWGIALFVTGASYGSILGDLESFFETSDFYKEFLMVVDGYTLTEQFTTTLMSIIAMMGVIPVIMAVLKIRSEEKKNLLENILATSVSRNKLLLVYVVIAMVSSVIMLFLATLGLWAAGSAVMESPLSLANQLKYCFVYLPAIWIMIGISVFLIGFLPDKTMMIWLYLVFTFFVIFFGGILKLPEWVAKLSPFGHIPTLPVDEMNIPKLCILTIIAVCLTFLGLVGYRNRDIKG